VPTRSGRAAPPPRAGRRTVCWKHKKHWSALCDTPVPHAQFYSGGQAFHVVYGIIHTTVGSLGCVNPRLGDARRLWDVLKMGGKVYVWGRRSGPQASSEVCRTPLRHWGRDE
jgi:hypothetical protein